MRRVGAIAAAEGRWLWRQRVVWWTMALSLAVLLLAAWSTQTRQQAQSSERARYLAQQQAAFDGSPDRHPHRMVHYGQFVFRTPSVLAAFDPGVHAYAGHALFLEGHRQNGANFSDAGQSALLLRFGDLSPAFVVRVLLPLLLVFLAAGTLARERDAGTLTLLQAQGVPLHTILLGKTMAYAGLAALWLLPIAVQLSVLASRDATLWARASGLLLSHSAYVLLWLLLIMAVVSWLRARRDVLLVLVALWCAQVIALPRMAPAFAQALYPLSARVVDEIELEHALHRLGDAHNPDDLHFAAFKARTLQRYGVQRVEDLPLNYAGLVALEGERLTSQLFAQHAAVVHRREQQQSGVAGWLAWGSPALALSRLSMTLAGSDGESHRQFLDAAEAHRYALVQRLNRMHAEDVAYHGDKEHRVSAQKWRDVPRFSAAPRDGLGTQRARLWQAVGSLLLWLLLPVLLIVWATRRDRRLS